MATRTWEENPGAPGDGSRRQRDCGIQARMEGNTVHVILAPPKQVPARKKKQDKPPQQPPPRAAKDRKLAN